MYYSTPGFPVLHCLLGVGVGVHLSPPSSPCVLSSLKSKANWLIGRSLNPFLHGLQCLLKCRKCGNLKFTYILKINSNCCNCLEFKFRPKKFFFQGGQFHHWHCLELQRMMLVKNRLTLSCSVTQLYTTLFDLVDYSLPGSSVCGVIQARILDWVAISFSMVLS